MYKELAKKYANATDKRLREIWTKGTEISDVTGLIEEAFISGCESQQELLKMALEFLNLHQEWEAAVISDNSLWWPYAEYDALRGDIYKKFLELQQKRNELYNLFKSQNNEY